MKVFRHSNGNLYNIQQIGKGSTITPNKCWNHFKAVPYKTNMSAPIIEGLGSTPDLRDFTLEFIT